MDVLPRREEAFFTFRRISVERDDACGIRSGVESLDDSTGTKSESPLARLSLSLPCFQPQRRQLGWFGRIARCRGLARSFRPESESVGGSERDRTRAARDDRITWKYGEQRQRTKRTATKSGAAFYRKRGATAVAAARHSPSGREGRATKKPTPQTGGGRGVVGERGRAGKSTHRAERRAGRRAASGGGKGVRRLCCRESSLGRQRSSHLISRWRRRWRQRARRVGGDRQYCTHSTLRCGSSGWKPPSPSLT